ncbi:MAG TPA: deoxynucleoside kinase [Promineifilum sp.]|nr:deoxynucleoside kinase [Promineifilum sp.]HRO24642.1 deoxynucleoside kinase [Promineifilum sp.]HRO90971.1 deoxynucleoside kinase [Promineifilum sp.]HRQ14055.1 deoxynucleoside kinase [Promineifilum sp.]
MGKIILIAGNSGVGKTTLANALCRLRPFVGALEQHVERPFQALMAADPTRYALANQLDYFLLRAEQERAIRNGPVDGLIDGGLDLDYHAFTQLFTTKGYLSAAEADLLRRLHAALRAALGPPDLVLYLIAPAAVVEARYARRGRPLEIAQRDDLALLEQFVSGWVAGITDAPVITIDAAAEDCYSAERLAALLAQMDELVVNQESGITNQELKRG